MAWHGCLQEPPNNKLIVQPPADHVLGEASCAHYTWGAIFNDKDGQAVWSFDKRTYTGKELETKVSCGHSWAALVLMGQGGRPASTPSQLWCAQSATCPHRQARADVLWQIATVCALLQTPYITEPPAAARGLAVAGRGACGCRAAWDHARDDSADEPGGCTP